MTDFSLMDARLAVLARYRDAGKGERFNMWFSYPGMRDGFAAIEQIKGGQQNPLLAPEPARTRRRRTDSRRRWCSPCLFFRPPARASR
jgi:hypothetical protein